MSVTSNDPTRPVSVEEEVGNLLKSAGQCVRERHEKCRSRIRETPTRALLGAVAAGYLLHRLPVRAILVTQVRMLSALTPPALFFFGAAKAYELLQRRKSLEGK